MKSWKICLLVFICSSSFAQPIDHGYISLTLCGKNIRIPIERISYNNRDDITLRAFGRTTEPSCNTIALSIVLHKLSTDLQDMNTKKSWLSLESKNDAGKNFYISFGFGVPFSFYRMSHEQFDYVDMIQTTDAQFHISDIECQNNIMTLTGDFSSSHVYYIEEHREIIVIQDGQFLLRFESDIPLTDYHESDQTPSNVESSIIQQYFAIVSQSENLNQEGNETVEYSSSENMEITSPVQQQPDHFSPKKFNRRTTHTDRSDGVATGMPTSGFFRQRENTPPPPGHNPIITFIIDQPPSTPPDSYKRRETHTGRGPLVSNPAPAMNDENNKPTRDSGVKRGGHADSSPVLTKNDDDDDNKGIRGSGPQRGRR
jgi:hypothetical protein